jgi:hypothetical protein
MAMNDTRKTKLPHGVSDEAYEAFWAKVYEECTVVPERRAKLRAMMESHYGTRLKPQAGGRRRS